MDTASLSNPKILLNGGLIRLIAGSKELYGKRVNVGGNGGLGDYPEKRKYVKHSMQTRLVVWRV